MFTTTDYEQMSIFDLLSAAPAAAKEIFATNCLYGAKLLACKVEEWMKKLVPNGEYFIMLNTHPVVLSPAKLRRENIPGGHEFYHYEVCGTLYTGIGVGTESDTEEYNE